MLKIVRLKINQEEIQCQKNSKYVKKIINTIKI
jgi:hypothetical protein